jgi:large subunit ribosomal protein L28
MGARCNVCGRRPQYGSKVSHSNRHTNRRFKVNVQHRRVVLDGVARNVYICTRCLRTMVKVPKERKRAPKNTATRVAPVAATTVASTPAAPVTAPETAATPEATAPATE